MMNYLDILRQLNNHAMRHKVFQGVLGEYYRVHMVAMCPPNTSTYLS